MLAVTRYRVAVQEAAEFRERAGAALEALTARPGCTAGNLGRSTDDPGLWVLATTWESVGAYRRALSAYDVKVHAVPLLSLAIDEPTAFEDLLAWTPAGGLRAESSDRAADAGEVPRGRG